MRVSVIAPVKNEVDFIGYSVMSVLPYVHEILYGLAQSDDRTRDLLLHIKKTYAGDKLKLFEDMALDDGSRPLWDFNPLDQKDYNNAFNVLIGETTGDAVFFMHPDMLVENPEAFLTLDPSAMAWWTHVTSYAGDFDTVITKGRGTCWKNIHAKAHGLHYYGGYGSKNEDFYHSDITGDAHHFHGASFSKYPFRVADSGISVHHFCELKSYRRRYEKMKRCMKTQYPNATERLIEEMATQHPRVHLQPGPSKFGEFEFEKRDKPMLEIIEKYRDEFEPYTKELCYGI